MIIGFLISYVCFTLPLIVLGVYRAWKNAHKPLVIEEKKTNSEQIMHLMGEMDRYNGAWFAWIRDMLNNGKRDSQAIMQATQAILRATMDLRDAAKNSTTQEPSVNLEHFVHNLEYVRDTYAKTPAQRKTVESIINTIRTNHGTESSKQ